MKLPAASRRTVLGRALIALALPLAASTTIFSVTPAQAQEQVEPLRIGIIGTGRIGGALARHWVAAGHEVFMSSRHPEELEPLAAELGPRAHVGMPCEAAAFGPIVLVSTLGRSQWQWWSPPIGDRFVRPAVSAPAESATTQVLPADALPKGAHIAARDGGQP